MKVLKLIALLGTIGLVSACAQQPTTQNSVLFDGEPATAGDATIVGFSFAAADPNAVIPALPPVSVQQIDVIVPRALTVSEANRYLPAGDIVWREDPIGDRHKQVRSIFEDGFAMGTSNMRGATPVSLYVQVMRFHALTEKARYSTGGVHSIKFGLAVRDLNTGRILGQPRIIEADLKAFGGNAALEAEAQGQTQKVRITNHLAHVVHQELTRRDGHQNAQLGIIQQMNRF